MQQGNLNKIEWEQIQPDKPFYLFTPQDTTSRNEYEKNWKITEIFPVNSTGIKTHRDHFVLDFENRPLEKRISDFRDLNTPDEEIYKEYELSDTRDWKMHERRIALSKVKNWKNNFYNCLYRPFDVRRIYYHSDVIELARQKVMSNMIAGENLGLVATRQVTGQRFEHILCTNLFIEMKTCSHDRGTDLFPIYLYTTPEETAGTLFAQTETTRKANLAPAFVTAFAEKLSLKFIEDGQGDLKATFGPEDVLYYAYAVFHNPTYRTRYAEFLKIDFPRLPLTSDKKLFAKLVEKGKQLVELHLLKSPKVEDFITAFPVSGDNKVEKVSYEKNKVWINTSQYFEGVPENVWGFQVGGYQVCEKWLKDRKERALSGEDIHHYQRVVVSLKETIRLMQEIDKTIIKWPME